MRFRTSSGLAVMAAAGLLVGTAACAQAAEVGFLEMLFGVRPAQQAQPVQQPSGFDDRRSVRVATPRLGFARRRLQTRYAALPLRIHAKEIERDTRQTPIDMSSGAAAAFLKDETLRPGDIVVLNTGARVFTGTSDKRHAMHDFEPIQNSGYVDKGTRKVLAGLFTPIGVRPGNEARRMIGRLPTPPDATPLPAQQAAMRVINVWQTGN